MNLPRNHQPNSTANSQMFHGIRQEGGGILLFFSQSLVTLVAVRMPFQGHFLVCLFDCILQRKGHLMSATCGEIFEV